MAGKSRSAGLSAVLLGALAFLAASEAKAITAVSEVEPNDTFATGQVISAHDGSTDITAFREAGGTNDFFLFQGQAGDLASFLTVDLGGGTFFDPVLFLLDPAGGTLTSDDDSGGGFAALINFVLPSTGVYGIGVGGFVTSDTFNYRLEIRGLTATPETVPEPATLALFGAGLAGLGWVARRRKAA